MSLPPPEAPPEEVLPHAPPLPDGRDPVVVAFFGTLGGILVGSAVAAVVLFAVAVLRSGFFPSLDAAAVAPAADATASRAALLAFAVLVAGSLGAMLFGGLTSWLLLEHVGTIGRRGSLALVAALGSVIAMAIAVPVNEFLGQGGLLGLAALAALLAWRAIEAARRLPAPGAPTPS
ncbi:MAG: hypothetical protein NW201_02840 [Gemmatimonadales bacterium]|nr:hypothetical protein [Gemmatimonadales bacterium]